MARLPIEGATKTRLGVDIGDGAAAEIAEAMLLDTFDLVRSIEQVGLVIALDDPESGPYFAEAASSAETMLQRGETFGERLAAAIVDAADLGYSPVVALGGDSPHIGPLTVHNALDTLADPSVDVVLGPAADGGYYLIASRRAYPEIIEPVVMSTPNVLSDTVALAKAAGLETVFLTESYDIDTVSDLTRLFRDLMKEASLAPRTLAALRRLWPSR
jgi:rSAM/selenodomain-associated transferase 1